MATEPDIIIWAVRWDCKYGISYRDLEEMLTERGIEVDHCTIPETVLLDKKTDIFTNRNYFDILNSKVAELLNLKIRILS